MTQAPAGAVSPVAGASAAGSHPVIVPPSDGPSGAGSLHRVAEVRQQEGLNLSKIARRMGLSIREVQRQEQPWADLRLSDLYRWQAALQVPAAELLTEPEDNLSLRVQLRAHLLRVMKTARSLQEVARQASVQRLIEALIDQLVEVMPELKETGSWPAKGQPRQLCELGQAFLRRVTLDPADEIEPLEDF
jgi:transcriptional regulator with XRE-family HTH domain